MDAIHRQVFRARRLLLLQRFLIALGWFWFGAMLLACVALLATRFWLIPVDDWIWPVSALGLGTLGAIVWTLVRRNTLLEAAIEIDRRFGLHERVSSALDLSPEERESEIGAALVADAICRIDGLDVGSRFRVQLRRVMLLPLLPAVIAAATILWIGPAVVDNPAQAESDRQEVQQQVKRSTQALRRKLVEKRKKAEEQDLKEAQELFDRLEQQTKRLADRNQGDRKKALRELNDLSREMKERRQALGGAEKIKEQLRKLDNISRGPADRLAKAVSRGQFDKAMQQIEKLRDQLSKGDLDKDQQQQLAEQLEQMQETMKKLADAHEAAQKDMEKRIEQMRNSGQGEQASDLEEQLEKLRQQMPQMDQLKELSEQLKQCSKCMKDGNTKDAEQMLEKFQGSLEQMQKELQEMEMLDEAMEQMAQARKQMNCQQCGGEGCQQCQAGQGRQMGVGLGEGAGEGERPEEEHETSFYDSQVRQKVGRGQATVTDLVPGPNVAGNVREEIKAQIDSVRTESSNPLSTQRIPRKHRQHAKEYFDRFREGK